jgi:hypothetical protein
MDDLHAWLLAEQPKHLPRGPLGEAIGYALNQWRALTRFLDDARLPVDNNASERALRPAALGRKNYVFVGNDHTGQNIAGLYALVATCEVNGVNPFEYLADVLPRPANHPVSRIDELLPRGCIPKHPGGNLGFRWPREAFVALAWCQYSETSEGLQVQEIVVTSHEHVHLASDSRSQDGKVIRIAAGGCRDVIRIDQPRMLAQEPRDAVRLARRHLERSCKVPAHLVEDVLRTDELVTLEARRE